MLDRWRDTRYRPLQVRLSPRGRKAHRLGHVVQVRRQVLPGSLVVLSRSLFQDDRQERMPKQGPLEEDKPQGLADSASALVPSFRWQASDHTRSSGPMRHHLALAQRAGSIELRGPRQKELARGRARALRLLSPKAKACSD